MRVVINLKMTCMHRGKKLSGSNYMAFTPTLSCLIVCITFMGNYTKILFMSDPHHNLDSLNCWCEYSSVRLDGFAHI